MPRYITLEQRDRIRARVITEYHRLSQIEAEKVATRERSGAIMVGRNVLPTANRFGTRLVRTQRKADGTVKGPASIKEKGWNGVPQNMPSNVYPSREQHRHYVDTQAPTTTVRSLTTEPYNVKAPFIADVKASDIKGRSDRTVKLAGIHNSVIPHECASIIVKRSARNPNRV